MAKRVEIIFGGSEGHCAGCIGQSVFTSSTLQVIGMVLTEHEEGRSLTQTFCYTCAMRRLEALKNDLMKSREFY